MTGEVRLPWFEIGLWCAFAGLFVAVVLVTGRPTAFAQVLAAVSIALMFVHAVVALGWPGALIFAGLCIGVSLVIENIGVATGFPFGRYHFVVGAGLPWIGAVPLIVGPLYFGMGYPSWVIANLLLDRGNVSPDGPFRFVAVPVTAAFVMVQWDVVMDPSNSTLEGAWVWHDGGGYFGVPASNFLGWFVTTYTYFQLIALALSARPADPLRRPCSRAFLSVPILLYLASGLSHLPPLLDHDARLRDGAGAVWSAAALRETAVVVMLFTMLPTALLALLRLFDPAQRPSRG